MPDVPINFAVDTDFSEFAELGNQGLVNAYVKPPAKDGATQAELRVTPGQRAVIDTLDSHCRGLIVVDDDLYAFYVSGTYKLDKDNVLTSLTRVPGSGPVKLSRNGRATPQIGVVNDQGLFYVIEGDELTPGPVWYNDDGSRAIWNSITYLDGFTILADDSGQMVATGINQMNELNGLDVAFAAGKPDGLRGVLAVNLDLWALGHETIEIWRTDPNAAVGFPMVRLSGGVVPKGCLVYNSAQDVSGTPFWLGDDRRVYRGNGYRPEQVSNRAVERAIEDLTEDQVAAITSYKYDMSGFEFYGIQSDLWTWELNVSTGLWAEKKSYNRSRWRASQCVTYRNNVYCGTIDDGKLYQLDPDYRVEDNRGPVIIEMRSAGTGPFNGTAPISNFRMRLATGRAEQYGDEPEMMIDYTDDGGSSWSPMRYVSLGKRGERALNQIKLNRLGAIREDRIRTWRVRISADHVVGVTSAQVTVG